LFYESGFRVAQRRVEGPNDTHYVVRLGTPAAFVQNEVSRLVRLMIPIALALTLLAPLGGYLLARRATAPIRQIIETTRRLRPSRLNERLSLRGAGDELDQLSGEINAFLDQIAGYLERHHEFIGNAAHELRSPLTAIQSSVDVALSKDRSREDYQELLDTIGEESERLRVLVNQLLTLAENDAVGLERPTAPVRLDEVVEKSLDVFGALAEDREIELKAEVQSPVTVPGDAARLRQVVNNLLDNALKFTAAGGRVTVNLHRDLAHHQAVLTVRDTGVGIPPEDVPRVFDRFYQVDKSHHRDGQHGNGLGLSIVQSIVQLHDGRVEVQSEPGRGAIFRVTLPMASSP
jgi:heavy metal sensor kinase